MTVTITIPGPPHAQGRPRAARMGTHVRIYDPPESRAWKEHAATFMRRAMRGKEPFTGPLEVHITAAFQCPRADYRKTTPKPRRWSSSPKDVDNIAKAVLDAGNGLAWPDDRWVVHLKVEKIVLEQGEEPFVRVRVREAQEYGEPELAWPEGRVR